MSLNQRDLRPTSSDRVPSFCPRKIRADLVTLHFGFQYKENLHIFPDLAMLKCWIQKRA